MPSLRRTASSPSVRSSPYRSPVAGRDNESSASMRHSTGGHGPRRSSGSGTSGRRVLADLEWWKVDIAGQRNDGDEAEGLQDETENTDDAGQDAPVVDRPVTPTMDHNPVGLAPSEDTVTVPFAAMSITPQTPPMNRRRHTLESSWSSLESTPEGPENPVEMSPLDSQSPTPVASADLGMIELPILPNLRRGRRTRPTSIRSFSFEDVLTLQQISTGPGQYADFSLSPLSPSRSFFNN